MNANSRSKDGVDVVIENYKDHPGIKMINENVSFESHFSFKEMQESDIQKEASNLNSKNAGTLRNMPTKVLKDSTDICNSILQDIWNNEILGKQNLKLADITPVTLVENYRPVNVFPCVSKVFDRIIQRQFLSFIDECLSPYLRGYRKGFNTQHTFLSLIEKWKETLDSKGYPGTVLMDLSKAFDNINHELLIAKSYAYGFSKDALKLIFSYMSDHWQRCKVNKSFNSWSALLEGVPKGSVLRPILFNIYLNELF